MLPSRRCRRASVGLIDEVAVVALDLQGKRRGRADGEAPGRRRSRSWAAARCAGQWRWSPSSVVGLAHPGFLVGAPSCEHPAATRTTATAIDIGSRRGVRCTLASITGRALRLRSRARAQAGTFEGSLPTREEADSSQSASEVPVLHPPQHTAVTPGDDGPDAADVEVRRQRRLHLGERRPLLDLAPTERCPLGSPVPDESVLRHEQERSSGCEKRRDALDEQSLVVHVREEFLLRTRSYGGLSSTERKSPQIRSIEGYFCRPSSIDLGDRSTPVTRPKPASLAPSHPVPQPTSRTHASARPSLRQVATDSSLAGP